MSARVEKERGWFHRLSAVAACAAIVAGVGVAGEVAAQPKVPGSGPSPAPLVEAGPEQAPPPVWCGVRPPLSVVLTYDRGRNFNAVTDKALASTAALADALCPGDVVRVSEYGLKAEWLGEPIAWRGPEDKEALIKIVRNRPRPAAASSVNELAVKQAMDWWAEHKEAEQLPVLAVFADTIESDAPRASFVRDFAWNAVPDYFQGRFMTVVTVLDRTSARQTGTVYVTSFPEGFEHPKPFPSGGVTTYGDVMEAFVPPPAPPEVEPRIIVQTVEKETLPVWLRWLGTLEGSLAAGGVFFALSLLLFAAGRRSRRAVKVVEQARGGGDRGAQQVTLILRDNLRGRVLHQETRAVASQALRVSPGSNADFIIPGPYAFEVLDEGGETPVIRAANMLGVELLRDPERRLNLAEGESLPLRHGDRINLGAGHELVVQLAGA